MAIDLGLVAAIQRWVTDLGGPDHFEGFFEQGVSPGAGVSAHRVTVMRLWDTDRRPSWEYAELFDDGTGFACTRLLDARRGTDEGPGTWILNEQLVWKLGRCLHLLGRHAVENCGAWGDALVEPRLVGPAMRLAYLHRMGGFEHTEQIAGGRELEKAVSRHSVVAEAACIVGPDLAAATRLIATDLFHAFGSPEVRQIAADGTLRARYLGGDGELRAWAEQHGIPVSDETVAGE